MMIKTLPIGIDDFEKLIKNNYYYVDKTWMIKELWDKKGDVNLFTRPRRFGKTLNMSMLRYFFELPEGNAEDVESKRFLFDGLQIMEAGENYLAQQGQYPVISISLKAAKQPDFYLAYEALKTVMGNEFDRHNHIISKLSTEEQVTYKSILNAAGERKDMNTALQFLSKCLYKVYGKKAIILIDEYDVPLENAYFEGFYDEMVGFLRSLFESALKSNPFLEFSVITGCLRISKESIFTGLNNLEVISITSPLYPEYFGFSQKEVSDMLIFYNRKECEDIIKAWYDGYVFGDVHVYNPWSVMQYVKNLTMNPKELPSPYWANTSSNSIVKKLVAQAGMETKKEIEQLIEGESIEKPIYEDITYGDVDKTEDNLWNFLFFTGYLKKISERMGIKNTKYSSLMIPNEEIRYIYMNMVMDWFDAGIRKKNLEDLYKVILSGDTAKIGEIISDNLISTISFYDYQESFYHGFMLGILRGMNNYLVISNQESGNGRPDIIVKYPSVRGLAIIMEFKVTREFTELDKICEEALCQIEQQNYEAGLRKEGYQNIRKYGIGFYKKECVVKAAEE